MKHCDSTCSFCANEFWKWMKTRFRPRPNHVGRSGPGDFAKEAAASVKPNKN